MHSSYMFYFARGGFKKENCKGTQYHSSAVPICFDLFKVVLKKNLSVIDFAEEPGREESADEIPADHRLSFRVRTGEGNDVVVVQTTVGVDSDTTPRKVNVDVGGEGFQDDGVTSEGLFLVCHVNDLSVLEENEAVPLPGTRFRGCDFQSPLPPVKGLVPVGKESYWRGNGNEMFPNTYFILMYPFSNTCLVMLRVPLV